MDDESKQEQGTRLSHLRKAEDGSRSEARMVDVSEKPVTARRALATASVRFPPGLLDGLLAKGGPKGPIEEVARVAGIQAAKRTGELIPMCHPLGLDLCDVRFRASGDVLEVRCEVRCSGRTGVEMEALTGASVAALTVIDMTKALTKDLRVEEVRLLEKDGGKSGSWRASR